MSKSGIRERSTPRTRRGFTLALVVAAIVAVVGVGTSAAMRLATWPTPAQEIKSAGIVSGVSFCGTKPITLAVLDGYGVNAWSAASYAAVRSEAAKCSNVKVTTAAGGGDLQKSISDITSSVAQGANAITVIPDFGSAELPAIQQATAQGVKVVPWGADASGVNGKDFVAYVDWNAGNSGTIWAQWMVKALHGKGNVIYTGGPAGNPVGAAQLAGDRRRLQEPPGDEAVDRHEELAGHELGSRDGPEAHGGAARQVPEDRRAHLQLRHGRTRKCSRVPGRRPEARAHHDARRKRAVLPVQEERDRALDDLEP